MIWQNPGYNCWRHDERLKDRQTGEQETPEEDKEDISETEHDAVYGWPGFDFEDQVAGWLILKVLTGQPLPGIVGICGRLQMQTEALGWSIDDILMTSVVAPDDERHLAISCKSNVQVTASGLPADFVTRCWQQWSRSSGPMKCGKDCLMLVTRGRHNTFEQIWSELKKDATGADLALALARMRATTRSRKVFDSVRAPAKDAGVAASDADVVAMVKSIEVAPVDFQIANSENEKLVIKEARSLLVNGSLAEGGRLWTELVIHAKNTRLGSGTLDISDLWRRLRGEFVLKDHPDYEGSWQKLRALTQDHKATIETAFPSGVTLDRQWERDKLHERISADAVCVVFGESGSGKSALVKMMLMSGSQALRRCGSDPTILISRSMKRRGRASVSTGP